MPRLPHGRLDITPDRIDQVRDAVADRVAENPEAPFVVKPVDTRRFDFLFPQLQDNSDNLLPESRTTRDALVDLGIAMSSSSRVGSGIPAAYTYFGQFVDHDITFDTSSATGSQLTAENLQPLPLSRIRQETQNIRTAALELDSVYGLPAPRDGVNMKIGKVTPLGANSKPGLRPPGKDDDNDLPREPRSNDVVHDRAALIGDPRNDENTIIAQLQVAFLRAHNKLVDEIEPPNRFRRAKRRLRRHYQHIVLHDFLKRIADPQIVDDIIENGNRVYDPDEDEFFMPLEYSVAAYRFGHSMVRTGYNFNLNFNFSNEPGTIPATLALLFTFTALSGQLGDFETLPENWIIEWENIIGAGTGEPPQEALRIDTELVEPLDRLRILTGEEEGGLAARLAVRNLLRGYLLRMPTGQAVAGALQMPELTPEEITQNAANGAEVQALEKGGFLERTPLWYYILAEAAVREDGRHLGPVGSTIVAEVLIGLIRRSPDSILDPESDWEPNLPSPALEQGRTLADLLRFAGVLTMDFEQNPLNVQFVEEYENLYRRYGEPQGGEAAGQIKQIIEEVIGLHVSAAVRPDAKLFLLTNLHQLFVVPLIETQRMPADEVFSFCRRDAITILNVAERLALERGGNPEPAVLSSHILADALSQSWENLSLTREEIW